jgi:RNA polymerase sigma-70 factor (ECF subfamily)
VANTGQADAQPIQSPVFSSIRIDSSLVAAAQRDRTAFAPLYQRYVDPIHRYCLRRLGSIEAAEDATAQIFTKALAALPAYREQGISFRSWLFTIAHNILVDIERGFRLHQGLEAVALLADRDPGPEAVALAAETRDEVLALLAGVPPEQRRVLELRLAGLSCVEIARVLSSNPGAVRATQYRAMTRLRLIMGLTPHMIGGRDD